MGKERQRDLQKLRCGGLALGVGRLGRCSGWRLQHC